MITLTAGLVWMLIPQVAKSQIDQDGAENLKKYYTAINRMQGRGTIKVEKAPRDYKGEMPFYEYYKMKLEGGWDKQRTLVSSFLDEKFVFEKSRRQEVITKLNGAGNKTLMKEKIEFQMDSLRKAMTTINYRKEKDKAIILQNKIDSLINLRGNYINVDNDRKKAFSYKAYADDIKIDEFLAMEPTDTFGLFINAEQRVQFINLRTGKCYYPYILDLNQLLESTTYLSKSPSVPDFKYDPSYSLTELFNYEWYYPESPEKMCKALEGLEVYRTDINDYDVISSVSVRRSDDWNGGPAHLIYDVKYQKGGYDKNRWEYNVFSVKWYEQLEKCIGMKVIFCNNGEERILYQDFLSNIPYWTLESVELGNLDGRTALVATIKQGQKTERLDAVYNGLFLTRNNLVIFPKDRNMYSHRLLPYDYVKKHAVKAPESVKSELSWLAKTYQESVYQSLREVWVGSSVSIFLSSFPNAKLVKNTVSGGKAIRIYHVGGNEFVFKDGVCTSVTKK